MDKEKIILEAVKNINDELALYRQNPKECKDFEDFMRRYSIVISERDNYLKELREIN